MFCRNCGCKLSEGTRFCVNCGTRWEEGAEDAALSVSAADISAIAPAGSDRFANERLYDIPEHLTERDRAQARYKQALEERSRERRDSEQKALEWQNEYGRLKRRSKLCLIVAIVSALLFVLSGVGMIGGAVVYSQSPAGQAQMAKSSSDISSAKDSKAKKTTKSDSSSKSSKSSKSDKSKEGGSGTNPVVAVVGFILTVAIPLLGVAYGFFWPYGFALFKDIVERHFVIVWFTWFFIALLFIVVYLFSFFAGFPYFLHLRKKIKEAKENAEGCRQNAARLQRIVDTM